MSNQTKQTLKELLASEHRPKHYDDVVAAHNRILHSRVRRHLTETFPLISQQDSSFAIALTGSDGRFEKSPRSQIELVLLYSGDSVQEYEQAKEELTVYANENNCYDPKLECKHVHTDLSCSFNGEADKIFPTRVLDAIHLVGSPETFAQYRQKLVPELLGKKGKSRLKRFDNRRRSSRQELENLEKRVSFNEETGELFFNDERIKSTKYSHLRPVQYKLGADLFKSLRTGVIAPAYLDDFPKRTVERLSHLYFDDHSTMSSQQVNDVSEAYSLAMYWYHASEEAYNNHKQPFIQVDVGELKEVSKVIKDFAAIKGSIIK